ncbi:MAG: hypothetical protein VX941_11110 [Pseudomonadota bacterium]|nr:hypothetical protein [Pseudomonadota bacterium]
MNSNFLNGQFLRKAYDPTDTNTAGCNRQSSLPNLYESVSCMVSDAESALGAGDIVVAESLLRSARPALLKMVKYFIF